MNQIQIQNSSNNILIYETIIRANSNENNEDDNI